MRNKKQTVNYKWIALTLIIAIILSVWAYRPGLEGGYYLDDSANIEDNNLLYISSFHPAELWQAMWSGHAGHLKRPIPTLSFALNIFLAENDTYSMKVTNLIIHIINSILLSCFTYLILKRGFIKEEHKKHSLLLALVVGITWLLHPFNLSSVLYIVQRMTSMSALFVLATLIWYLTFRIKQTESKGHWPALVTGTLIFFTLAIFCKENAILIPFYVLTIECFILKFQATNKFDELLIKGLVGLSIVLPIIAIISFIVLHPSWLTDWYAGRNFNLGERLLTETRVLSWYIRMIITPNLSEMSVLLDDIEISKSLLSPITTLFSIIFLFFLLILIFVTKRKFPVLAFGLSWFFAGHLLESTVIPLELAFEHRNYLPSLGILLTAICFCYYIFSKSSKLKPLIIVILFFWFGAIILTTHSRALQWRTSAHLALFDAEHRPNSVRANIYAGNVNVNLAFSSKTEIEREKFASNADRFYLNASKLDTIGASPDIGRMIVLSLLDRPIHDDFIQETAHKLKTRILDASTQNALIDLGKCQIDGNCKLSDEDYINLTHAMISNKKISDEYKSTLIMSTALYYSDKLGNFTKAKELIIKSIRT